MGYMNFAYLPHALIVLKQRIVELVFVFRFLMFFMRAGICIRHSQYFTISISNGSY